MTEIVPTKTGKKEAFCDHIFINSPLIVQSGETRLHFLPGGKKIEVLPPSSRRQATVHRTVAFICSSLAPYKQKSPDSAEADSGLLVRVARLELAASWSQTRRPTNWATPGY